MILEAVPVTFRAPSPWCPHGTDNADRTGRTGGTTSSALCCCDVPACGSAGSLWPALLARTTGARPAGTGTRIRVWLDDPSGTCCGLQQADTCAVATVLGTIWGPHDARDPEQHARGRTSCTLVPPDMRRWFLWSLLLGVKGSQVQILSSRRCEGSSRATAREGPFLCPRDVHAGPGSPARRRETQNTSAGECCARPRSSGREGRGVDDCAVQRRGNRVSLP
jgi:hypothetical protein